MESFPAQYRIRASREFDAVFRKGDFRAADRNLLCLARRNRLDHPRLGMVVAKRNVQGAVERNRIKRVIRESFRRNREALPCCDIVVVCRPGLAELDSGSITDALDKVWHQLRDRVG